jgi:hypothetical protein
MGIDRSEKLHPPASAVANATIDIAGIRSRRGVEVFKMATLSRSDATLAACAAGVTVDTARRAVNCASIVRHLVGCDR